MYIISSSQNIGDETMEVFKEQFKENGEYTDKTLLKAITKLITDVQNNKLGIALINEEVKQVVFLS